MFCRPSLLASPDSAPGGTDSINLMLENSNSLVIKYWD